MINLENYYLYSLYEINSIKDPVLKEEILTKYDEIMTTMLIGNEDFLYYGMSISSAYNHLENYKEANTSIYLFPGDTLLYYPKISEVKASKNYTCLMSGATIKEGSNHIVFKVAIFNKSNNIFYITKELRFENHLNFDVPKTLIEFENLILDIESSVENRDAFYDFYVNNGGNIELYQLKRRKNQKKS